MEKSYTLDDIIQLGTQIGIKVAHEEMQRIKHERLKERHDKRLRNTKLLLEHYRNFINFYDEAIFKSSQSPIQILQEFDEYEGNSELFIESISKSRERTNIIIKHIQRMIMTFRFLMEQTQKDDDVRKYKTIYMFYIDENKFTIDEIAKDLSVDTRNVYRYKNSGIEILTGLIFGVDGIKMRF